MSYVDIPNNSFVFFTEPQPNENVNGYIVDAVNVKQLGKSNLHLTFLTADETTNKLYKTGEDWFVNNAKVHQNYSFLDNHRFYSAYDLYNTKVADNCSPYFSLQFGPAPEWKKTQNWSCVNLGSQERAYYQPYNFGWKGLVFSDVIHQEDLSYTNLGDNNWTFNAGNNSSIYEYYNGGGGNSVWPLSQENGHTTITGFPIALITTGFNNGTFWPYHTIYPSMQSAQMWNGATYWPIDTNGQFEPITTMNEKLTPKQPVPLNITQGNYCYYEDPNYQEYMARQSYTTNGNYSPAQLVIQSYSTAFMTTFFAGAWSSNLIGQKPFATYINWLGAMQVVVQYPILNPMTLMEIINRDMTFPVKVCANADGTAQYDFDYVFLPEDENPSEVLQNWVPHSKVTNVPSGSDIVGFYIDGNMLYYDQKGNVWKPYIEELLQDTNQHFDVPLPSAKNYTGQFPYGLSTPNQTNYFAGQTEYGDMYIPQTYTCPWISIMGSFALIDINYNPYGYLPAQSYLDNSLTMNFQGGWLSGINDTSFATQCWPHPINSTAIKNQKNGTCATIQQPIPQPKNFPWVQQQNWNQKEFASKLANKKFNCYLFVKKID